MLGVRSSSPDGVHRHVEDHGCRRCGRIWEWSLIPGADLPAAEKYGQTEDGPSDHGAGRGEDPVTEDSLLSSCSCFFYIVSSSWIRTSALNLPAILVRRRSIAERTTSLSGCWNSWGKVQIQSSHLSRISTSSLSSAVMM